MNKTFTYVALLSSTYIAHFSTAQNQVDNIFLDRKFWSKTTTIEQINEQIAKGNDLSASNRGNFDAYYFGIMAGTSNEVLKYIVQYPNNGVHKPSHDGRTNLFWSASTNNVEMVKFFLQNGAKTDLVDEKGSTPLLFAVSNGCDNLEIYDLLLKYGSNVKKETSRSGANALLLAAPHAKNLEIIEYFTKKGLSTKSKDEEGNGILEYAAQGGNITIIKELQAKYKVKPTNQNAVLFAANGQRGKQNGVDIYKFIKEELQLSLKTTNSNGQNALHIVAGKQINMEVLDFLKNEIDFRSNDIKGNSILHYAAKSQKNLEIIKLIVDWYSKENDLPNDIGATPLLYAIEGNSVEVVDFLAHFNSAIDKVDANGNDYVTYLAEGFGRMVTGDLKEKVQYFHKNGMRFDTKQANGNTIFHLLAQKGDVKFMDFFKDYAKGDINKKNELGLTPLHIIAMNAKSVEDIRAWMNYGFDKTILSDLEESVYQLASENELLIEQLDALEFLK